jgi:hypothetical protein
MADSRNLWASLYNEAQDPDPARALGAIKRIHDHLEQWEKAAVKSAVAAGRAQGEYPSDILRQVSDVLGKRRCEVRADWFDRSHNHETLVFHTTRLGGYPEFDELRDTNGDVRPDVLQLLDTMLREMVEWYQTEGLGGREPDDPPVWHPPDWLALTVLWVVEQWLVSVGRSPGDTGN